MGRNDIRTVERFARFHGLAKRIGRFVGGPVGWHHRNPERVRVVRGWRR